MTQQTEHKDDWMYQENIIGFGDKLLIPDNIAPNIQFAYKGESISITLKNGEDILKVGKLFAEWLTSQGIEVVVKHKEMFP